MYVRDVKHLFRHLRMLGIALDISVFKVWRVAGCCQFVNILKRWPVIRLVIKLMSDVSCLQVLGTYTRVARYPAQQSSHDQCQRTHGRRNGGREVY